MLSADPTEDESFAEALCREKGWSPERVFRHQYLITPESQTSAGLPTWHSATAGSWTLWYDPDLPVHPLKDATGAFLGLLCGVAIGPDDNVIEDTLHLPFKNDDALALDQFEELLMDLRGRYITLLTLPDRTLLYTDPVADMGAVYDPASRRVGLSMPVVLNRRLERAHGVTRPNLLLGHVPLRAGMTPDAHVRRLLPNHRLDLRTFTMRRFWPKIPPFMVESVEEEDSISAAIAERLAKNVAAFTNHGTSAIPISGGIDSRILLGLAAAHEARPTICFTHRTNWISGYDAVLGYQIADALGVPYRLLDAVTLNKDVAWAEAAKLERTLRFVRSGFSTPKVRAPTALAQLMVPKVALILRGNVMEMLGGRFHRSSGIADIEAAYNLIWGREPASDEERRIWQAAYCGWLADLTPGLPEKTGLDLAFVELLYSHAIAVVLQSLPQGFFLNPFADRRLIAQTMRISSQSRRSGQLYNKLLRHGQMLPKLPSPRVLGKADALADNRQLLEFLKQRSADIEAYTRDTPPNLAGSVN